MTRAAHAGISAAALLAWSAAVLGVPPAAAQPGMVVARAASVSGPSMVATSSGVVVSLTAGSILTPGDRIDTRSGGRVVIDLSDGSMVVIDPGSVVLLKDFRQASSLRELFEITVGMVRVKINHFAGRPNPYRMNSPTASIAVRGTEFSIQVDAQGNTAVIVYEGAVQVSELNDPGQTTLVEAGRGVLVGTGQEFRLFTAPQNRGGGDPGDHNNANDADRHNPPPPPPVAANAPAPLPPGQSPSPIPLPSQQPQPAQAWGGHPDSAPAPPAGGHANADAAPVASSVNSSAYDRYISGLADISQLPFLLRYNAFAESYLDSLENPAYATQFHEAQGQFFLLPSYSGTAGLARRETPVTPGGAVPGDYSISPQFTIFSPIGQSHFYLGGSVSASRVGNNTGSGETGLLSANAATYSGFLGGSGSTSDYFSGALVLAARWGRSSFGAEWESLHGTGTAHSLTGDPDGDGAPLESFETASSISQNRFTAGYSLDFSSAKLGVFYRYALIDGSGVDNAVYAGNTPAPGNSTSTYGHSSEFGLRLRGRFSRRLTYGITAGWLSLSLTDALVRAGAVNSHQWDGAARASAGLGLGYQLTRRVTLAWDMAGASTRSTATRFADATGTALQNGTADSRFFSAQAAAMVDLTRRLFVSASLMNVWHGSDWSVALFPDQFGNRMLLEDSFFPLSSAVYPIAPRFSDFGVGWRFSRHFTAQYLFSTDYGFSGSSHALMLRYTFGLKKE